MDLIERFLAEKRREKQGWQSVEPGDYVDLCIFDRRGRLLLVQGERNPAFGRKFGMWGVVSETIEASDGILLTACRRAIREEVGGDQSLFRINFASWSPCRLNGGEIVHRLAVSFTGAEAESFSPQNPAEVNGYQWVNLPDLASLTAAGAAESYVLPLAQWFKFYEATQIV